MPRRKIKQEAPAPNAYKHKLKFGWCTDGNHKKCHVEYTDWNKVEQRCICSCHKEK